MPEDAIDLPIHDPIRDLTSEQERAEFMTMLDQMNEEERGLLRLTALALWPEAVARAIDRPPQERSDGPDAELIRLCDHLRAVHVAEAAAYEVITEEDQTRLSAVVDPLYTRGHEIRARILELEAPTTLDGAEAAAWALLDLYPDRLIEARQDGDLASWLAVGLAEYLVEREPPEIGFGT